MSDRFVPVPNSQQRGSASAGGTDFERRIAYLLRDREKRSAALDRFPRVLGVVVGATALALSFAGLATAVLESWQYTGLLISLILAACVVWSGSILGASLWLKGRARAITLLVLGAVAVFYQTLNVDYYGGGFGYSNMSSFYDLVRHVSVILLFVLAPLFFGVVRTRVKYPGYSPAGVIILVGGLSGLSITAFRVFEIFRSFLQNPVSDISLFHAVLMFMNLASLLSIGAMFFIGVASLVPEDSHSARKRAWFSFLLGVIAALCLVSTYFTSWASFFYEAFFSGYGGFSSSPIRIMEILPSMAMGFVLFAAPYFLLAAAFTDLFTGLAFKRWSGQVDVEIARMKQEMTASAEDSGAGGENPVPGNRESES